MSKLSSYLAYLNILIVAIALCVGTFFIPRAQLDLSESKIHTVSKEAINFIQGLKDVVRIDVYATKELPPEVKPLTDNLNVILDDMAHANPGKLQINYFDPNTNEAIRLEAEKNGMRALQFTSVKNDKLEVQTGYFGFVVKYNNKQEVVPVAGDIGNLEYTVVSSINKLVRTEKPKLLIASGNGEWGQDEIGLFQKYIVTEYDTIPVRLNDDKTLDASASALLIVGPKGPYNDNAKGLVKSWIDSKKGVAFWYDPMFVTDGLEIKRLNSGLDDLFKSYGFEFNTGFLSETGERGGSANFTGKQGTFFIRYNYWPEASGEGISRDVPLVSSLNTLVFPWSSSLKASDKITPIVQSSRGSFMASWENELNPLSKNETKALDEKGKHIIAAIKTDGVRLGVIADADFVRNQFIVNNQQNLAFAINMIDYLSQNESLMGIRSKQIYTSPVPSLNDYQKNIIKISGIGGSIFVLIAIALLVYIIRKRSDYSFSKYV